MANNYANTAALIASAITSLSFAATEPEASKTLAASNTAASQPRMARKPSANPSAGSGSGLKPCASVVVDPPTYVTLGKSSVIRLSFPVSRMVVGGYSSASVARPSASSDANAPPGPAAAAPATATAHTASDGVADVDITLLSPTELFFLGKRPGSMNVVLQNSDGRCLIKDIIVTVDPNALQAKLGELMPEETGIKVRSAEGALVLTGEVSDAVKLDHVMSLATSYGDGKKVVNLMRITTPQQVMLEVKIAEVSKTLLDKFGIDFSRLLTSGSGSKILSGIFGGAPAVLGQFKPNAGALVGNAIGAISGASAAAAASLTVASQSATLLGIDAQKKDGLIRILAEPNIMAINGQMASFLSGGKIFIPVAQSNTAGGSTITLEEKEFGVGLKFMPTVLNASRVNLKITSEVSELSQTGSPFTTVGGVTSVLPSIATRRVDTTVQLNDGQSFAIAGLIKNNVTETISRFPGLGEVPVIGALFRSTEFQSDQTELIFIVTPRMVKPLTTTFALPTDNHVPPNRADVLFMGKAEGTGENPPRTGQPVKAAVVPPADNPVAPKPADPPATGKTAGSGETPAPAVQPLKAAVVPPADNVVTPKPADPPATGKAAGSSETPAPAVQPLTAVVASPPDNQVAAKPADPPSIGKVEGSGESPSPAVQPLTAAVAPPTESQVAPDRADVPIVAKTEVSGESPDPAAEPETK